MGGEVKGITAAGASNRRAFIWLRGDSDAHCHAAPAGQDAGTFLLQLFSLSTRRGAAGTNTSSAIS